MRHQWHQSWAGHNLRSSTAPSCPGLSWKLSSWESLHLPTSKFWPGGKLGDLVYKLSFLSPGKANNTKSFQRVVLTLWHPASHHSSFNFAIPSYFPSFLRSPQWAAPCGSCFQAILAPSVTSVRNSWPTAPEVLMGKSSSQHTFHNWIHWVHWLLNFNPGQVTQALRSAQLVRRWYW